jgi:glutamine synthetase
MENPNTPDYRYFDRAPAEYLHRNGEQVLVSSASILERTIGSPSAAWTEHDLAHAFVALELRQVSLMHVAGDGKIKTLDFVPRDHNHFLQIVRYGERADGSSLFPGSGISAGASDIVLRPMISTAFIDPFSEEGTLAILCSHTTRTGEPLPQSPVSIVTRAYERLRKIAGFELHALGEVEYFLGCKSEMKDERTEDRGYHAASPYVAGQDLRRRALTLLAQIGVPVKYAHSEVGFAAAASDSDVTWEQHEIELALAPLPDAATNVVLTQWVLRNLAREYEMEISFDPVVRRGHAGSGMHFHLAPSSDDQFLAVYEQDGQVSESAKLLIVGLLAHGCSLMAFGNRTQTSFVRLFQGKESPTSVTWGQFNRKALVRLPVTTKDAAGSSVYPETVEFRLPDGSANPHLLLAGIAQAASHAYGLKNRKTILERMHCDAPPSEDRQMIPTSSEAVAELLEDERDIFEADGVYPPHLIDTEIVKLREETAI